MKLQELHEAKNHMGDTEYGSYKSWKAGIKKAAAGKPVTFTGDVDIDEAHVDGKAIGEWDGAVGCVYKADVKEAKAAANVGMKPQQPTMTPANPKKVADTGIGMKAQYKFKSDGHEETLTFKDGCCAWKLSYGTNGEVTLSQNKVENADIDPKFLKLGTFKSRTDALMAVVKRHNTDMKGKSGWERIVSGDKDKMTEGEDFFSGYEKVAKAKGWKKRADHLHHPLHGTIEVTRHGHWAHKPHGSTEPDDGFEGTTTQSLEKHLGRLKD